MRRPARYRARCRSSSQGSRARRVFRGARRRRTRRIRRPHRPSRRPADPWNPRVLATRRALGRRACGGALARLRPRHSRSSSRHLPLARSTRDLEPYLATGRPMRAGPPEPDASPRSSAWSAARVRALARPATRLGPGPKQLARRRWASQHGTRADRIAPGRQWARTSKRSLLGRTPDGRAEGTGRSTPVARRSAGR